MRDRDRLTRNAYADEVCAVRERAEKDLRAALRRYAACAGQNRRYKEGVLRLTQDRLRVATESGYDEVVRRLTAVEGAIQGMLAGERDAPDPHRIERRIEDLLGPFLTHAERVANHGG